MTSSSPAGVAKLPSLPGVYRFRDGRGRVLYVGRALNLRRRVASYWSDLRGREHLRAMVPRVARIEAAVCDSGHEAAWLERNLLEHSLREHSLREHSLLEHSLRERGLPPWNRTAGGAESPVYIGLDGRPRAPGLRVVHAVRDAPAALLFGPYLGGDKARLAVAGLHRALPLGYTGTGLTGTARDLAGKRGVGPADRDALVAAVTAVLAREPAAVAAVRGDLAAQRDRAAGDLAFERAARIQAEIDAITWITDPQRVTGAEPADFEVHGWDAGVLVRFQMRAGRLCTWTARACTPGAARRHVAGTPADWTGFAHRNAELAARLRG